MDCSIDRGPAATAEPVSTSGGAVGVSWSTAPRQRSGHGLPAMSPAVGVSWSTAPCQRSGHGLPAMSPVRHECRHRLYCYAAEVVSRNGPATQETGTKVDTA